jgi:organic radical activating enzyme
MRGELIDSHGRIMRDLRVSVTDRCNYRCLYCLPETEDAANFYRTKFDRIKNPGGSQIIARTWKARDELLSFEEIERIVSVAVGLGIEKIRLTGGEPLLRKGLPELARMLGRIEGVKDLAMTTNGFLFAPQDYTTQDYFSKLSGQSVWSYLSESSNAGESFGTGSFSASSGTTTADHRQLVPRYTAEHLGSMRRGQGLMFIAEDAAGEANRRRPVILPAPQSPEAAHLLPEVVAVLSAAEIAINGG